VQQTVVLVRGASQGAQDGDVDVVQKSVVSVGNGNDDLGPQLHTVEAHNLGGGQQQGEVGRQEDVHDAVRLAFDLNVGCEEAHLELGWVATGLNEPSIPDDVQFSDQAAEVALTDSSTMSHQDAGLRAVLGNAEGRINKDRQELGLPKNQGRGVPKFVAPLRKSLLCNPFVKTKPMTGKKTSTEGQQMSQVAKKNIKLAVKGSTGMTIEEKATILLMKTSGMAVEGEAVSDALQDQFGGQFVNQMDEALVGDMRTAFGIAGERGVNDFEALAVDDDE
jgi:hypothetical protein